MVQIAEPQRDTLQPESIEATLSYLRDTGELPWTYSGGRGSTEVKNFGERDERVVTLHNGRPFVPKFSLDRTGFHFIDHDTKVANFYDEADIRRVYYPEM